MRRALLLVLAACSGETQDVPQDAFDPRIDAPDPFNDVVPCDEASWGSPGECEKACEFLPPMPTPADDCTVFVPYLVNPSERLCEAGDSVAGLRTNFMGHRGCCMAIPLSDPSDTRRVIWEDCLD
jgi:hypothetical protein